MDTEAVLEDLALLILRFERLTRELHPGDPIRMWVAQLCEAHEELSELMPVNASTS